MSIRALSPQVSCVVLLIALLGAPPVFGASASRPTRLQPKTGEADASFAGMSSVQIAARSVPDVRFTRAMRRIGERDVIGIEPRFLTASNRHEGWRGEIETFFPATFPDEFEISGFGLVVRIQPLGGNAVGAAIDDGKLVYHEAYPHTDSIHRLDSGRSEEILFLRSAEAPTRFEYRIVSTEGVARTYPHDRGIRFVDRRGRGLCIEAPWVVDAAGVRSETAASWTLDGSRLWLTVDPRGLTYPLAVDPTWTTVSSLRVRRYRHSATLLSDGRLLVAGGENNSAGPLASSEIYDPATGVWSNAGVLQIPRTNHTATLLSDGRVLVVGGYSAAGGLVEAEVFDPMTRQWTPTGNMSTARREHTATLLRNGMVLVVGGTDSNLPGFLGLASAEVYNPATGTWTPAGTLTYGRQGHAATLLADGRVLIVGGSVGGESGIVPEIYDPTTGLWSIAAMMLESRQKPSATLLADGRVLVAGGFDRREDEDDEIIGDLQSAEIYDPGMNQWVGTGSMNDIHTAHSSVLLPSGQVLVVAGGSGPGVDGLVQTSAEIYDPATEIWSLADNLAIGRKFSTATLLPDGDVLIVGGTNSNAATVFTSVERFDTAVGQWQTSASMNVARNGHSATLLRDGRLLVAGGATNSSVHASAEIFDPSLEQWTPANSMATPRTGHAAILLRDGRVLVVGGYDTNSAPLASAEIFDPDSGMWSGAGNLSVARIGFAAVALGDGTVMVAGGDDTLGQYFALCEIYDPATNQWTPTGNLRTARSPLGGILLSNGRVLVAGGLGPFSLASCEIYEPMLGTWRFTDSMSTVRFGVQPILLANGNVLATGGDFDVPTSAEIFDPAAEEWTQASDSLPGEQSLGQVVLPDGRVLAVKAGDPGSAMPTPSQVFDPETGSWAEVEASPSFRVGPAGITLLADGSVLATGGYGLTGPTASVEIYQPRAGIVLDPPVIASATDPAIIGGPVTLTGVGFRAESEGNNGAVNNSAGNGPIVQVTSLVNGEVKYLPVAASSSTSATCEAFPAMTPGLAVVRILAAGIASSGTIVRVARPAAPSTLAATAVSPSRIDLTWQDTTPDELGFKIEQRLGTGAWSQIAVAGAGTTAFSNIGLLAGTEYSYRIRAFNAFTDGEYSNIAMATTFGCVSLAILQHPQSQTIQSNQSASLFVAAQGAEPLSYQWFQQTTGGGFTPVSGATSSVFNTGTLVSTTAYRVRVTDACGSVDSDVAIVTVQLQVTNTGDSGAGSLRDAIALANSTDGVETIRFNFMGAGPHVVNLATALPVITKPVIIDGYSQPGSVVGTPVVVLNGAGAGGTTVMDCDMADMGAGVDGLHVAATASGSTVRGLVIQNFTGDGIEFEGGGTNTVTGCYIGTNAAGTMAAGNGRNGIYLNASANNQIGGDVFAGAGNLISGNHCAGIEIRGSGATSNVIEGCYIGTNASGTGSIGNQFGIRVDGAPGTLVGSGDDAGRRCRVRGNTGGGVTNTNTGSAPLMTVDTIITGNVIVDNGGGAIVGGAGAVPVVTGATLAGTLLTVTGQTTRAPNTDYDVEYFRNTVCGLGGGQGEEFLAKVRKRTTGAGVLDLSFSSTQTKTRPGELIAVTVTGPGGTSNFSLCEVVTGRLSVVARATAQVNLMGLPSSMNPKAGGTGRASGAQGESPLFGAASERVYREEPGVSAVNVGNGFGAETASPGLGTQFEGLDDNPVTEQAPSDAQGAVGPAHAVTITQLEIAVQAKATGAYLKRATVEDFFAGIVEMGEPGLVVFNPRAAFDPYWPGGGRWMVAAAANGRTAESAVLVAVSQTSDPLGDWNVYRYEGDVSEVAWSDYPTLGFTKDWVAVHVNMLTIGSDAFARGEVYLLDKASLYGGTPGTGPGTVLGAIEFATAVPALTYSGTEGTLWLMSAGRDEMTAEGLVNVFAVRGSVGGETLTAEGSYVATGGLWDDEAPNRVDFAPQMGTLRKIQVNDARLHSVVYRGGRLWCGQTVLLPRGGAPTRSAVQYWEIDPGPSTPGIVQRGMVDDATGTEYYAYPSIAVNESGNVVFGYSKFSGTSFAGAAYRYRTAGDGAGVLRDEVMLRAGEASYDRFPMDARNRWGNYSAAMVDGGDDETLWVLNNYAKQPEMGVDQWGTYWGAVGNVSGCQVTCPSNVTANADAGECSAVVTYSAPTTTGDCQTVVCAPASGTTFGVGVTTVTCTNSGNAAQCSFTVTVVDNQAPSLTCPSNITTNAAAGDCSAVVTYTTPSASDNCAGATVECAPASGSTFTVGTTTVTCTATDASGNTTECTFMVTVNDMEAPVIQCPSTLTAVAGATACSAPVNFNLSVSDNCPGAITVETSHPLATAFPVGTTQVTVTATDVSGNSSSCQVMVTVTDVTAPVFTGCASNVVTQAESNAGAAVVYAAPAATDACGATVVCAPASGTTFGIGTTTVTCTATDASSNATNCQFTVTVEWPEDSVGAVNASAAWFLKDTNGQGPADAVFFFGDGTDVPIAGDWNGDGRDTVGVYRPSLADYYLKNGNTQGDPVALAFTFGAPGFGFVPVMGDWDGNGTATVGFYSPSNGAFFIKNTNAGGDADLIFFFGGASQGRIPIVGDWNGDGVDGIGLYNPAIGSFELKNVVGNGFADVVFFFGAGGQGYLPVVGDWDNDGRDGVGLYSPGVGAYFLKNELTTTGVADRVFFYGPTNARPVAGNWDVRP